MAVFDKQYSDENKQCFDMTTYDTKHLVTPYRL